MDMGREVIGFREGKKRDQKQISFILKLMLVNYGKEINFHFKNDQEV